MSERKNKINFFNKYNNALLRTENILIIKDKNINNIKIEIVYESLHNTLIHVIKDNTIIMSMLINNADQFIVQELCEGRSNNEE